MKQNTNGLRLHPGVVSQKNSAGQTVTSFVQVSRGMSFTYDPTKPQGSRLVSLNIGQADPVPPVDLEKTYTLVTVEIDKGACRCHYIWYLFFFVVHNVKHIELNHILVTVRVM